MRKVSFCTLSVKIVALMFSFQSVYGQDVSNFVQFYINPSLVNPSLTGVDGKSALYLSYKKQWAGISGAPSIANASLQGTTSKLISFGVNLTNDTQGLLTASSLLFSSGYTIPLPNNSMFRFGMSIGAGWNKVDMTALNFGATSPSDPIMADLLDNNFQLLGSAGVSFHTSDFHIGLALPNIIQPRYLSSDAFNIEKISPFESALVHASYRLYFAGDQNVFEPYLIYRYNQSLPSQFEFSGVFHLQHKVWIGGSYKQDFGISGVGGFKPNNQLAIGYAYTLKNTGANELNKPSHEITLALLFGGRQKNQPYYSFVETEKPGIHGKTKQSALARKKQKQKELAKKRKEQLAKKNTPKKVVKTAPEKTVATKPPEEPKVTPVEPTPKPPTGPIHDGGPRRSDAIGLNDVFNNTNKNDSPPPTPTVHHDDEEEKLSRLEIHKDNAADHHGEDNHPNAERHEFVKRGSHSAEMNFADYVIVGAFRSEANAKRYSDGLRELGFDASDYGFISERQIWYVHISESNDINQARADRDRYRKMNMFKDAWLLTVHE
ncbi:MAG TPA: PorP/SprF family type IX secretion system membrane protein [Cyclobacteriaceae bacterium]|nr:PorP/SprF family type IX secretion system membrane protein [Cyclobacteriaceae bacterium]